jgi:hypothetical protein
MEKPSQAVHIAPLGVENERISEPVIQYEANQVILMEYLPRTPPLDDVHAELEDALSTADIQFERKRANLEDLFDALSTLAQTIEDQREKDEVYVNVSSGNKVAAIAGMIACMATDQADPYYVKAEAHDSNFPKPGPGGPAQGVRSIQTIPRYPMDRPSLEQLAVMHHISTQNTEMRDTDEPFREKRELWEFGENRQLPFMSGFSGETNKGKFQRLRHHILDPLMDRGYISIESRSSDRVMLTEDGKNTLRAFQYLVEQEGLSSGR